MNIYVNNGKTYTKITKSQVKSMIKKGKSFKGFIVGCNVNQYHFFNGWYLAFTMEWDSLDKMESYVANWEYFNTNSETGNYCHFYRLEE